MIKVKLLGCLFILISSWLIGNEYSKRFTKRLNNLIYLQNCIQMLETEIVYASNPLLDAFKNLYEKGNKNVSFLFKDIGEYLMENKDKFMIDSFKYNLEKSREKLALNNDDIEVILSLGRTLGTSDTIDQQKHFKTAIMNLELNQKDAKEDKEKNAKMYKSLGALFGMALVLMLY